MFPVPYGMAGVGGMFPLDAAASIPQPMPITASSLSAKDIPLEDLSLLQDYESQQLLNDFTCYSVSDISFEKWHIGSVSDIAFELRFFDLYGLQGTFSTGVFLYFFFVLFKG
ncbi:hypothetical protein Hanom_Chr06g00515131 [Helianthus anomalus]